MFGRTVHQTIHFTGLILAAFFMPLSVWLLSAVTITLAINWIAGGEFRAKLRILSGRTAVLMLLSLFAMYLLWLINTKHLAGGMDELRLKLPLLAFPVIIGTTTGYTMTQVRTLLLSFITGCIISAGIGFLALGGLLPVELNDSRDLAVTIPSIRLSLLLSFAIFTAAWLSLDSNTGGIILRVALAAAATAMAFFLFRLLSVTGIIIFTVLLGGTGLYLLLARRMHIAGLIFAAVAAAIIFATFMLMSDTWRSLHQPDNPDINRPLEKTLSGNSYVHYHEESLLENGYLVWVNVCEEELEEEWSRRSKLSYEGTDMEGNELRTTIIRYISFLGMTKDSVAVAALTSDDIRNIERGFANPLYARTGSPRAKAYEIAWQIDRAMKGANPSGHSVTQRPEFYRASLGLIRRNPWFGTGTGDVITDLKEEYRIINTRLTENYRKLPHNQYLGFAIVFGIPGMVIALALMLIPWIRSPNSSFYPFVVFISIIFMSMFNDDTFHSSIGTAFFSYFYTLLLVFKKEDGSEQ
ncbi:MAG: O-antigen ligase family protein [Bacteroidales bacterium]|jgi:hypothetical protein|nr:O-antigen ligase family protein [Bacteroidales bacterium]